MHRPPPAIIDALDANHDGVIDADEIANAVAVLQKLDKNGDGKLTPDEFLGPPPDMRGGPDGDGPTRQGGSDRPKGPCDPRGLRPDRPDGPNTGPQRPAGE
jgi:hypothetical protein